MSEETVNLPQTTQPQRMIVVDNSEFSSMLDTARFEQMWRIAAIFADSQLVPAHYQKNKSNCFLGLQMAFRLGVDPMMLLQNTYIVGGRPGMESKMIIALINSSGLFDDPLDYEIVGEDPKDPSYKVRAIAVRKGTKKKCTGPWIDWAMVKAEGWDSKGGSKWKTIPGQMFCYRAAAFFGRLYCPERLLGMQTAEELQDTTTIEPVATNTATPAAANIMERFKQQPVVDAELPMTDEEKNTITTEQTDEELQPVYALIHQLAELKGDTPDDTLDDLTGGKCSTLIELRDKGAAYINDLMFTIQSAITKAQA